MTISRVSSAAAEATSLTMPTHQAGDLIIMSLYRDDNVLIPDEVSGWTVHQRNGGSNNVILLVSRIAQSSGEVSGTWTNGRLMSAVVYRSDTYVMGLGNAFPLLGTAGSLDTISYTAMNARSAGLTMWIGATLGHISNDVDIDNPPDTPSALMTNVAGASLAGASTGRIAYHDTNTTSSGWDVTQSYNLTVGTSAAYRGLVFEIVETAQPLASGGALLMSRSNLNGGFS